MMSPHEFLHPSHWKATPGYSSGVSARGRLVVTGGIIGWNADQVFETDGVKVVVDPKSFLYLNGTEIDYVDGLTGAGFTMKNPNATGGCGCGSSFKA